MTQAIFGDVPVEQQCHAGPGATGDSAALRYIAERDMEDVFVLTCDHDYLKLAGMCLIGVCAMSVDCAAS